MKDITDWILLFIFGLIMIILGAGSGILAGQTHFENATNAEIARLERKLIKQAREFELDRRKHAQGNEE